MPTFICSPQILVQCGLGHEPSALHSLGQTEITAFFVDARIFAAWVPPSMPTLRRCPRQGTPNPGWLLGNKRNYPSKRTSRLAIHLLFPSVQVRKSTGNGESDMGAGDSVIECALMGIQQTHKPKQARKGGAAPKLQSLMQSSLRFFAALLGLGLLGYLVFRSGPGAVWKQLQAIGWGFALVILL